MEVENRHGHKGPLHESNAMTTGDPTQVIGVLRDVLLAHMDNAETLPEYQVQSAVYIGRQSGRLISESDITSCHDVPGGLRLTMRSGHEYELTLNYCQEEPSAEGEGES